MSKDITYSLDFIDTLSFNLIRQALRQDRQINWYDLKKDFDIHQIFSDWLHQAKQFDEDDIIKDLKAIVSNRGNDHAIIGYSNHQFQFGDTKRILTRMSSRKQVSVNRPRNLALMLMPLINLIKNVLPLFRNILLKFNDQLLTLLKFFSMRHNY